MAAPLVLSVTPGNNQPDVVLGSQVSVTFDQAIDPLTVTEGTFSLTGPGQTQILTPDQMIQSDPQVLTGREYITGTYTFTNGNQTVIFNPVKPLTQLLTYTVLLMGGDGQISADSVKNPAGEAMAASYRWVFTTGDLNVITPPPTSPLPAETPRIDPKSIRVLPRPIVGNDLSQEIDFVFPSDIEPSSFNLSDLLISLDGIVGDPDVEVPPGVTAIAVIEGNRLKVTITGWPA